MLPRHGDPNRLSRRADSLQRLPLLLTGTLTLLMGGGLAWWIHSKGPQKLSKQTPLEQWVPEPPQPSPPREALAVLQSDRSLRIDRADGSFLNIVYTSVVVDPRWITVDLFAGWNREQDANRDEEALVFTSGPTFARSPGHGALGMRLHGDLLLANGLWRADNRAAAAQRAWMGINRSGELEFGYGPLTEALQQHLRVFVGGLHAFTNTTISAPPSYRGVYGPMRLADVRIVFGLRPDGQLELVETADGVLFSDLETFVEEKGFLAAYLPDHASKSRLIVPGRRLWSDEHAEWVSGGRPSITQMPFLLKLRPTEEWRTRQPHDDGPAPGTN